MDKDTIQKIEQEMMRALQDVENEHGVMIKRDGGISYTSNSFRIKFEVVEEGGKDREAEAYDAMILMYGLPKRNSIVKVEDGKQFRIIGFNTRAKKLPILAIEVNSGKKYKLPIDAVQTGEVVQEAS